MKVMRFVNGLAVAGVLLFFVVCMGLTLPFEIAFWVCFGRVLFLRRVLPQITVDWGGVATALVALTLFTFGLHRFLCWLSTAWNAADSQTAEPSTPVREKTGRWRLRWTAAMVGFTVLMFTAGVAMVGLAHQLVWLARAPEPMIGSTMGEVVRRMTAQNGLKRIGLGLHNYADVAGSLPPGGTADPYGRMMHSWQTAILPFYEELDLYDRLDLSQPWTAPKNAEVFKTQVGAYRRSETDDRTQDGLAVSDFAGSVDVLGPVRARKFSDITDGLSNTLLAAEAMQQRQAWGSPTNWRDMREGINRTPTGFGGDRRDGSTVILMADGSVRTFNGDTDPRVLNAMATPAAGD